jgi:hypothetical protein
MGELKPLPTVKKWVIMKTDGDIQTYWKKDSNSMPTHLYDSYSEAMMEMRLDKESEDYRSAKMNGWELYVLEVLVLPGGLESDGIFKPY